MNSENETSTSGGMAEPITIDEAMSIGTTSMAGRKEMMENCIPTLEEMIAPISPTPAVPIPKIYAPGVRVKSVSTNMSHYGYNGTIDEIKHGSEIWIRWSDGDHTYVGIEKCNAYLQVLDAGYECPIPPPVKCTDCIKPCPDEEVRRETIRKQEEARQKYIKEIKISQAVIDYWQRELKEHIRMVMEFPFMYLLGMSDNIITEAHVLRGYKGCKDMQRISPYELSNAYITFQKKGLTVAGIGRVGIFSLNNTQSIDDIYRITGGDGIMVSVNADGMCVRQYINNDIIQEAITHRYVIVKQQKNRKTRKEVRKNASKESEKGKADQSASG